MDRVNDAVTQFMRVEHYRLHCAEQWADGPCKDAVLASAYSKLERLEESAVAPFQPPVCMICAARKARRAQVLPFPSRPQGCPTVMPRAA
jgi:hypothetical protein